MTEKPVWYEYLGNIDGELLLQNLTNTNPHINSIDEIRSLFAEIKTRGESLVLSAGFSESKRLVQLVIEPGECRGDSATSRPPRLKQYRA